MASANVPPNTTSEQPTRKAIPEGIRRPPPVDRFKILNDDQLRELRGRAGALEAIAAALHNDMDIYRGGGDPTYFSILWLSEGLAERIEELAERWQEAPGGSSGDDTLADLDAEVRRLRKEADAFNTLDTEEQGNPPMVQAEALVRRMAATMPSSARGALLLLDYLDEFREIGIEAGPLASIRRILGGEVS